MTTFAQAQNAQKSFEKHLKQHFNAAAGPVNSVGISRNHEGFYLSVGLERQPTAAENAKLPVRHDGVAVKYKLIGPIVAF